MAYSERADYDWSENSIRIINSPSVTAKSAYYYVQETGYFQTQPRYYTERAHLNSYLVVYTLSGKGTLLYNNKSYTLHTGQAFFIDCIEHQLYKTDKDELWEFFWVHFNGSSSRSYYEQYVKNGSPVAALHCESVVPDLMRQIIETQRIINSKSELISSQLIVHLLTELLLNVNYSHTADHFLPDYIQAVLNRLEKRFNEKITLDQLAHSQAVNKFHLAKEFKKYTGYTPNEYLINLRINYAKEMLQYSGRSVADIANIVGIDNVSHFINLFKHRIEMTPLAYRKQWQPPSVRSD